MYLVTTLVHKYLYYLLHTQIENEGLSIGTSSSNSANRHNWKYCERNNNNWWLYVISTGMIHIALHMSKNMEQNMGHRQYLWRSWWIMHTAYPPSMEPQSIFKTPGQWAATNRWSCWIWSSWNNFFIVALIIEIIKIHDLNA